MKQLALAVAVAVVLLGACSSAEGPPTDVFGDDGDDERLVLLVDIEGGATQGDYLLAFPPTYSIYADGSMYFMGGVPSDPPPFNPLLKTIGVAQLTGTQRRTLATMLGAIGLADIDNEVDLSRANAVVDAYTTRATLIDLDGVIHSFGVYNLRRGHEETGTRNEALAELLNELNNIAANNDLAEHRPERLEITWRKLRREDPATALAWPVSTAPADFGVMASSDTRCILLEGNEALETAELLSAVAWDSLFTDGETVYRVISRNLLPSEVGCA